MIERKITAALVFAIAVQTGGALVWAGAAAQRISTLEDRVDLAQPIAERLARVEAELGAVRAQLDRIESRLERIDD
jgi:HAMP domain-containing protein